MIPLLAMNEDYCNGCLLWLLMRREEEKEGLVGEQWREKVRTTREKNYPSRNSVVVQQLKHLIILSYI